MKTNFIKITRIAVTMILCLALSFCKEPIKIEPAEQLNLDKPIAQLQLLPTDGPGTIWTKGKIIRVESPITNQLKNGSTGVTTDDNENNALGGIPDNDMDIYLNRFDVIQPIEFNIFIEESSITDAKLSILAYDIDWNYYGDPSLDERDEVSLNGHFLGYLTGANDQWSTSIFTVDPAWVNHGAGLSGKNLVKIVIDVNAGQTAYWAVQVDWGQLVINGGGISTASFRYVDIPSTVYQAGEVVIISEEVDADPGLNVRVETNLVDPLNNIIAGTSRTFTATNGEEPFIENLTLPSNSLPGAYKVMAILYDAVSSQQLDIEYVPFQVGCINPTIDAGPDVSIYQQYTTAQLNAIGSGTGTYLWSPATGLSDPNIANPVASPLTTTTYTVTFTDQNGCSNSDDVVVTVSILPVVIDIKPNFTPNSINCNNPSEIIPIAILTTANFDATMVDHETVKLEGAGEFHKIKSNGLMQRHVEDVDLDGDMDLVLHFLLSQTNLNCTSLNATLTGNLYNGAPIIGTDEVRMVNVPMKK